MSAAAARRNSSSSDNMTQLKKGKFIGIQDRPLALRSLCSFQTTFPTGKTRLALPAWSSMAFSCRRCSAGGVSAVADFGANTCLPYFDDCDRPS